jgi:hypothetical protein
MLISVATPFIILNPTFQQGAQPRIQAYDLTAGQSRRLTSDGNADLKTAPVTAACGHNKSATNCLSRSRFLVLEMKTAPNRLVAADKFLGGSP